MTPGVALPNTQRLLHITHARQDDAWVRGVVIPALGLTESQYWTRAEDDLGMPRLEELERAVQSCRYTLLVASRAARFDEWTRFGGVLAQHLGIEEGKPRLIVVTRDFDPLWEPARDLLPLRQRCLVCLDCSDPEQRAAALAALAAQLALTITDDSPAECPYPGLRMFGAVGAGSCFPRPDLFFGRDDEGCEAIGKLRSDGRVLLVGPSGCGKSSLVHARVLPALSTGPDAMTITVVRPGAHPDVALRAALDTLDGQLGVLIDDCLLVDDRLAARPDLPAGSSSPTRLIYVDQLEEVFVNDSPAGHTGRARFFACLGVLARLPDVAILLGMRADFYGDLMRSPVWSDFKDHRVELTPLRGAALRQAITRPAEVCGVHVEVDLVERLVREADLDRAAEALPLLQVALEQLWAHREWRYLSLANYERIADGKRRGLDVVLARHADAVIAALDDRMRMLTRRVLVDLVHLGEGRPDTRRRRSVSELCCAGDDASSLPRVLAHLSMHRLISIGTEASRLPEAEANLSRGGNAPPLTERHVDLAHDALITGWPALAGWINVRRDDLRTQRRLEARAASGGVLDASELAEFTGWLAKIATPEGQELGVSEALHALVRRSVAARARRVRGLVAFILGLVAAAGIALWQRGVAVEKANEAVEQRRQAVDEHDRRIRVLARLYADTGRKRLLDEGRPLEALPYLVAARNASGGTATESLRMLFAQAIRNPFSPPLQHHGEIVSAAFSPDGARVVTASLDHTAQIWNAASGQPVSPPLSHQDIVWSAAFSPDGTRVVTASSDLTARVWDTVSGKPLSAPLVHHKDVRTAVFSPDGTRVVTASSDRTARVWDAASGEPRSPALVHYDIVWTAAFDPSGTRVVTASQDGTARVWDAASGELRATLRHSHAVLVATFSPDGTRIVTASLDRTARVWDAVSGKPISPPLLHPDGVKSAAFSPDGARVVTAGLDNAARIWDVASGALRSPPIVHQGLVRAVAFSPDGTRVVTASDDRTARVWDAVSGMPVSPVFQHQDSVRSAVFSRDGTRVATASLDQTARVWDADAPPVSLVLGHRGIVRSGAFSSDGARVVTASDDHTARVWSAVSGEPLSPPLLHQAPVWGAAFSPDDTRVVTASDDHTAQIWDAVSGQPLTPPLLHQSRVSSAAFSPDGARVVTASDDHTARVWSAASGQPLLPPLHHQDKVQSAAFSPDGTRIVTASEDQTARIWNAASGQPLSPPLEHQGIVWSAVFSPDGTRIVTASHDCTSRVWNAVSGQPISPPLVHQGYVRTAMFSRDGGWVITASADQTARVWSAMPGAVHSDPFEHQGAVLSAVFSPDGSRVVTASDDQTARVWDVTSGKQLAPSLAHHGTVRSVAFSPDGTRILTISDDHTARIWDVPLDSGAPADWRATADRSSPFRLTDGVLTLTTALPPSTP